MKGAEGITNQPRLTLLFRYLQGGVPVGHILRGRGLTLNIFAASEKREAALVEKKVVVKTLKNRRKSDHETRKLLVGYPKIAKIGFHGNFFFEKKH